MKVGDSGNPERYYFDDKAADDAVKWIEKYCRHTDDLWEGQNWELLDWQKKIVRDIFGWKRKDTKRRRYKELYLELGKGNGKTPLLVCIAAYHYFMESGKPYVLSAAGDFKQASVSFDLIKAMIELDETMNSLCDVKQYTIRIPKTGARWDIISGDDRAKSGPKPSCCILDEYHEAMHRNLYYRLRKNALKRSEPLILVATNAGDRLDSPCYELHERALRVIEGTSKDEELYAVVFAASKADDPASPATWAKANPSLDKAAVTSEMLEAEWKKVMGVPTLEADFRRFHLSQWIQGSQKYFDMALVRECTKKFSLGDVINLPLVVGLDMSLDDDLTAMVLCWIGKDQLYVKGKFWLPRKTAYAYEDKGIPYSQWEAEKAIRLVDSETIDPAVQMRMSKYVEKLSQKYQLKGVCYDPAKATNIVANLESAGITAIKISQGFHLSASLQELSRRLKDKSITIYPNKVMTFCFDNAETRTGDLGGIRLVKPGAEGKYKGNKNYKNDGVSALITAMEQVRAMTMQPTKPSTYETRGVFVL